VTAQLPSVSRMARQFLFILLIPVLVAGAIRAQQPRERYRLTPEDVESVYGVFDPVLSPDGKQFAVVRSGQIVLQPVTGGWPVLLTSSPGGKADLAWSPDGKELAFSSQGDIWDVPASGGQPRRLTDGHVGPGDPRVATDRTPRWSPDGKWIIFQSGRSGQNELWVVSEDGRSINFLVHGEIYHGPDFLGDQHIDDGDGLAGGLFFPDPAWSPDGTRIAYTERSREFFSGKLKLIEFDPSTGRAKGAPVDLYTAKPDRGGAWAIDKVSWSPDGKTLAFTLQDTGWDKVYLLSASGGQPKQLTQGESEDSAPVFSPDGKSLAIVSNRNAPEERHIWIIPIDGSAPHRLTNLPTGVENNPFWSPDGTQIYFIRSTPLESSDLYVASTLGNPAPRALTHTLPPNFAAAQLSSRELVHFKADDGLTLSGILYYPPGYTAGNRYPAVLWVHGGPEGQDTLGFSAWPLFLSQEGYVVFRPNYRGGIGYGEKFRNLNVGDSGGGEVQDIGSAVRYLIDRGLADPKRIAIGGTSHGATMVHYAVTKLPDFFVAAISYGGAVNRATFLERTNRNSEIRWEIKMGGTPLEKPEAYHQTDIIPDVAKIKAVLLIQYGDADPQLPPYESVQLINALKKEGKPFLAFSYPGEYHEFSVREYRLDVWKKQQQFLREYLLSPTGRSSTSIDEVDLNLGR
jgi:dipeptidyl aminopeptidase/acylaminoacyl peptidase